MANPADAERVRMAYQLGVERWMLEARLATTEAEQEAANRNRPDPAAATADMWRTISGDLDRPWIIPHAAWFINMADSLARTNADGQQAAPFADELRRLIEAIQTHHLDSPDLAPVCMALANGGGPERHNMLERIRGSHPQPTVRGVAALAQSLALKALGDEPDVLRKRLDLLREAIIHSADVPIHDESTVGDLAAEELYLITNLTKGRTAPDLAGNDVTGRTIRLSDEAGKIIVLVFWSATDANARELIEFCAGLHARMRGRPVEVIGINGDASATLRPMIADGTVTWRNISDPDSSLARQYRIGMRPLCFVLDAERTIRHIGQPGAFIELTASALADELENPGTKPE